MQAEMLAVVNFPIFITIFHEWGTRLIQYVVHLFQWFLLSTIFVLTLHSHLQLRMQNRSEIFVVSDFSRRHYICETNSIATITTVNHNMVFKLFNILKTLTIKTNKYIIQTLKIHTSHKITSSNYLKHFKCNIINLSIFMLYLNVSVTVTWCRFNT